MNRVVIAAILATVFIFENCAAKRSSSFHLTRRQVLKGALIDPSGAVVAGLGLYVKCGKITVHTKTDEMGRFEFSALGPGTCHIGTDRPNAFLPPEVECTDTTCNVLPTIKISPKWNVPLTELVGHKEISTI